MTWINIFQMPKIQGLRTIIPSNLQTICKDSIKSLILLKFDNFWLQLAIIVDSGIVVEGKQFDSRTVIFI